MTQTKRSITLEEVLSLAKQLSPVDKVRLIEQIAPQIERELVAGRREPGMSLRGLLKELGPAPSAEEIDTARREAPSCRIASSRRPRGCMRYP